MTSRKQRLLRQADDQLDVLIRCALRERVARAAPSQGTWERIRLTVGRSGGFWHAWGWLGVQMGAIGWYVIGDNWRAPGRDAHAWHMRGGLPQGCGLHWMRLNGHQVMRLVV